MFRRRIDPIVLVGQGEHFELFDEQVEMPVVRHEMIEIRPRFDSPIIEQSWNSNSHNMDTTNHHKTPKQ